MSKITPDTKIAIGLPCGKDGYDWLFIEKLLKMFAAHPASYLPINKQAPHADARNRIVWDFLKSEAEWLLWIDNDTVFEPEDLQTLMDLDMDIVTGIQFTTGEDHFPLLRYLDKKTWTMRPLTAIPTLGPFEVDGCGFGFVLMKRRVLETVTDPWFEFKSGFSEDLNFCFKAKHAGFKIVAHPRVLLGHINKKIFTYQDFMSIPESFRRMVVDEAGKTSNAFLKRCHPNWIEDLHLRETFDPNVNTREYWDSIYSKEGSVDETWRDYPGKFPFISKELLTERSVKDNVTTGMIPPNGKVLELGCGMGVLLKRIKADHPKFRLQGIDISQAAIDSVKSLGIEGVVGSLPEVIKSYKKDSWDAVIGTEILEHLDDGSRLETIKEAYRILKPGGLAVFTLPDNILPPEEIKEHRVCYQGPEFCDFLKQVFKNSVVYSKKCLVSDKPRPDGQPWAEAPFLFGVMYKER